MKTVLLNGKVYVEKGCYAEAVLIEDGFFKVVGTAEEVLAAAGDDFEKIDCEGRTVIPGLNDTHLHLMQVGEGLQKAPINKAKSIKEMIQICRDFIEEHPERVTKCLRAEGWNQDLLEEQRIPNRHDLDQISTEIPIALERVCKHIIVFNTKALEVLGIDENFPDIEGGEIQREENGYPNGIMAENAAFQSFGRLHTATLEELREYMIAGMEYAVAHGLTSVQSNDAGFAAVTMDEFFGMCRDIYEKEEAPIRFRHQVCFHSPAEFEEYLTKGEFAKYKDGYGEHCGLTLGPLKLFKDGSLGGRTALMTNGYVGNPEMKGLNCITDEDMAGFCKLAKEYGVQIMTHCIGDEAARQLIKAYETAFVDGENKLRHSINHCQITDNEILDAIVEKDIVVQAQPIFIDYDRKILVPLCGAELAETSYAFGTLLRRGAHLSYGTDSPVENLNPFPNLYMAVTRKGADGTPEEGFYPEQCVDVETAIDAYTAASAYNEFQEDVKGRIKPGFYADLVVLDKDIFTCDPMEIKDILPVMTMVGGKVVFKK